MFVPLLLLERCDHWVSRGSALLGLDLDKIPLQRLERGTRLGLLNEYDLLSAAVGHSGLNLLTDGDVLRLLRRRGSLQKCFK